MKIQENIIEKSLRIMSFSYVFIKFFFENEKSRAFSRFRRLQGPHPRRSRLRPEGTGSAGALAALELAPPSKSSAKPNEKERKINEHRPKTREIKGNQWKKGSKTAQNKWKNVWTSVKNRGEMKKNDGKKAPWRGASWPWSTCSPRRTEISRRARSQRTSRGPPRRLKSHLTEMKTSQLHLGITIISYIFIFFLL